MNRDERLGVNRQAVAWLEDGPSNAPTGLLAATLARSRETRQRPALVALALGAPRISIGWQSERVAWRPVLIALALLLVVVAMLAVIGSGGRRPLTAVTSSTPTASPAAPLTSPRQTELAATPIPTFVPPTPPAALNAPAWGISITRDSGVPWQAIDSAFHGDRVGMDVFVADQTRYVLTSEADHAAWDVYFGSCAANGCGSPVITISVAHAGAGLLVRTTSCTEAPPALVFDCMAGNDEWPVLIDGRTAAELKRKLVATFGRAAATRRTIDGEPAFLLQRGDRLTLVAVHGDLQLALLYQPNFSDTAEQAAAALDALIANFHFD